MSVVEVIFQFFAISSLIVKFLFFWKENIQIWEFGHSRIKEFRNSSIPKFAIHQSSFVSGLSGLGFVNEKICRTF